MSAKSVQVVIPKGTKLHIEGHHVEFQSEVKVLAHPDPADGSTNEALTRAIAQVNGTASPAPVTPSRPGPPSRSSRTRLRPTTPRGQAPGGTGVEVVGQKPEPVAEKSDWGDECPCKRKQVDEFDEQDSEASGILEASSARDSNRSPDAGWKTASRTPSISGSSSRTSSMQQHSLVNNNKSMPGYDQALKGLQRRPRFTASIWTRSPIPEPPPSASGSIQRMIGGDTEALLEESEEVMKAMLEACENAISKADEILTNIREGWRVMRRLFGRGCAGKLLRNLLERAIRLRRLAQSPVPPGTHLRMVPAYEATHVLRFMVYVFRSDLAGENSPSTRPCSRSRHHAKIAVRYWLAREGVRYYSIGTPEEIKAVPRRFPLARRVDSRR